MSDYSEPLPQGGTIIGAAPRSDQLTQGPQPTPPTQNEYSEPLPRGGTVIQGPPSPAVDVTPAPFQKMSTEPGTGLPVNVAKRTPDSSDAVAEGLKETVQDAWGAIKGIPKAAVTTPPQLVYESIQRSIPALKAYENARSQGKSISESYAAANEVAKNQNEAHQLLLQRMDEFKKTPGQATVHALGDAALLVASFLGGKGEEPEIAEATHVYDPVSGKVLSKLEAASQKEPGFVQQVIKGEKIAQPKTEAAIRQGAQAGTEKAGTASESMAANIEKQPILKGDRTVVDDHLDALKRKEDAAYDEIDKEVGFDLKAQKLKLMKLERQVSPDPEVEGQRIETVNNLKDLITEAEDKLKARGIDPDVADNMHKQRVAGRMFKKALVDTTDTQGNINVDALLTKSKKLRFQQFHGQDVDRLAQFMGKDGADGFISDLETAQKAGAKALARQDLVKLLGRYALRGAGLGIGYETLRNVF